MFIRHPFIAAGPAPVVSGSTVVGPAEAGPYAGQRRPAKTGPYVRVRERTGASGSALRDFPIMFSRVVRIVLALLALVPAALSAQSPTSHVAGVVRDTSGGSTPGVIVRVVSEATGAAREAISDEEGAYRVESLAPGRYRVEASLDGFETAVARGRARRRAGRGARRHAESRRALTAGRRRHRAARRGSGAGSADSGVGRRAATLVDDAGAFNVNRLKELIPTVQFYSTNPRNSSINIRGLGAPFGLTNDGIEPGVGLYIDGVFYARPAAATLDFLDVERSKCCAGRRARSSARTPRRARST